MKKRSPDSALQWEELDRKTLLEAHVFSVLGSRRRAADGAEADYVLVESADWCNVIAPVTRSDGVNCFVMARQFRHGSRSVTIEFPGGLVEHEEAADRAALRELEEETGYTAESLTLIGKVNPNPAFMNNVAHTFVAHGVHRVGEQQLDANERLDVSLVPVSEIVDLLRPDFHEHAIMTVAIHWYSRYVADGLDYDSRVAVWNARAR